MRKLNKQARRHRRTQEKEKRIREIEKLMAKGKISSGWSVLTKFSGAPLQGGLPGLGKP